MSTNNEMCQGCTTSGGLLCDQTPIRDDIVCPCVSCIVKTMCTHACEEYDSFTDPLIKDYIVGSHS